MIICKMPDRQDAITIEYNNVRTFHSLSDLPEDAAGFIVSPFDANDAFPIFLFEGLKIKTFDHCRYPTVSPRKKEMEVFSDYAIYERAFNIVKEAISTHKADKIVLSRSARTLTPVDNVLALFSRACKSNPHCYVALIEIPGHDTWLIATPELLYKAKGHKGKTTALAGTMPWADIADGQRWSEKNKQEQQVVVSYIENRLTSNKIEFQKEPLHYTRAGEIAHLQTDFTIHNSDSISDVRVIKALHPTPAVAGIPLQIARETIKEAEGENFRQYYAGFSGFLRHPGYDTECYVSLRLAHIASDNTATLYAGGGIMPQSVVADEWKETSLKLNTIISLL